MRKNRVYCFKNYREGIFFTALCMFYFFLKRIKEYDAPKKVFGFFNQRIPKYNMCQFFFLSFDIECLARRPDAVFIPYKYISLWKKEGQVLRWFWEIEKAKDWKKILLEVFFHIYKPSVTEHETIHLSMQASFIMYMDLFTSSWKSLCEWITHVCVYILLYFLSVENKYEAAGLSRKQEDFVKEGKGLVAFLVVTYWSLWQGFLFYTGWGTFFLFLFVNLYVRRTS